MSSSQEVPTPSRDQGDGAALPVETTPTQTAPTTSVKAEPRPTPSSPPSNGKASEANLPAEICVVIGGSRNSQAQGEGNLNSWAGPLSQLSTVRLFLTC